MQISFPGIHLPGQAANLSLSSGVPVSPDRSSSSSAMSMTFDSTYLSPSPDANIMISSHIPFIITTEM